METQEEGGQRIPIGIGELIRENNRILILKISKDAELDVAGLAELFTRGKELMQGVPYCLITDARVSLTATKEAREYAAENIRRYNIIANAILSNSLPVNLLANFYIRFNQPAVPTHLFSDERKAREWIAKIIERTV